MSKEAHIVAVETSNPDFEGYKECNPFEAIKTETWIGPRPVLEELDSAKYNRNEKVVLQTIPYVVVEHNEKVLVYIRPSKGNESRLHGKVTIGVGGHVDLDDVVSEKSIINLKATLSLAAVREIEEEIGLAVETDRIEWTGLIMRRDGPVDRVHLGYVAKLRINDDEASNIKETEETGKIQFMRQDIIEENMVGYEIEAWTNAIIRK